MYLLRERPYLQKSSFWIQSDLASGINSTHLKPSQHYLSNVNDGNTTSSGVSVLHFEQINAGWEFLFDRDIDKPSAMFIKLSLPSSSKQKQNKMPKNFLRTSNE